MRDNFGDLNASYDPTKADNTLTGVIDGVTKTCPGPCRMDFNGDRQLWVSAKATVRGRPRTIVARLKLEQLRESVPQAGVVAGAHRRHQQRQQADGRRHRQLDRRALPAADRPSA